jgi:hypothetical protein
MQHTLLKDFLKRFLDLNMRSGAEPNEEQVRTYELRPVLEAGQPTGIVEQTLELVVVNVVLKFREETPNKIANEHHLRLKRANNG